VPALELESEVGDQSPGLQSRVVAAGLRTLSHLVANAAITVIFLNQAWTRQTQSGENWETSAGGPALKLHSAVRIAINKVASDRVRFRVLKNKAAGAFATGELTVGTGPGFTETL
jgi:recombination protein RecA